MSLTSLTPSPGKKSYRLHINKRVTRQELMNKELVVKAVVNVISKVDLDIASLFANNTKKSQKKCNCGNLDSPRARPTRRRKEKDSESDLDLDFGKKPKAQETQEAQARCDTDLNHTDSNNSDSNKPDSCDSNKLDLDS
eukprot:jgi/Psemu1/35629/gm1.35629_g